MPSWRDHFLNLTIEARKQYVKKYADRIKSPSILGSLPFLPSWNISKMSKQEMIDFALSHNIYTKKDLEEARRVYKLENPPTYYQIMFLFGSFSNFQKQLKNSPKAKYWNNRMTDREFVQFCSRIHIRGYGHYLKIKKEHPEFELPSADSIIKRFGRWELFMSLIRSFDVDLQLDLYFKKSISLGHALTLAECDKYGIEIRYLKSILTEQLLRKLLYEKERWYRKNKPDCFLTKIHRPVEGQIKLRTKKRKKHEKQRADYSGTSKAISEAFEIKEGQKAEEELSELQTPQGD